MNDSAGFLVSGPIITTAAGDQADGTEIRKHAGMSVTLGGIGRCAGEFCPPANGGAPRDIFQRN
jgi:hypothetical protein